MGKHWKRWNASGIATWLRAVRNSRISRLIVTSRSVNMTEGNHSMLARRSANRELDKELIFTALDAFPYLALWRHNHVSNHVTPCRLDSEHGIFAASNVRLWRDKQLVGTGTSAIQNGWSVEKFNFTGTRRINLIGIMQKFYARLDLTGCLNLLLFQLLKTLRIF